MSVTANQNIVPFLWFDGQAEAAMQLYTSIFPGSEIRQLQRWGNDLPGFKPEWIRTGVIEINGLRIFLFDAGPQFKFNESVSFMVTCKTQEEIDNYWTKLTANGGKESECGWCKDPFGFSWQIVPELVTKSLQDGGDPKRIGNMMQALWKMKKLDLAALQAAYDA